MRRKFSPFVPGAGPDPLEFDIAYAIKHDTFVPTTRRARSEWADHAAERIAARLRLIWDMERKEAPPLEPGAMRSMSDKSLGYDPNDDKED